MSDDELSKGLRLLCFIPTTQAADRIEELGAKLEKLIAGAETVLEEWDRGDERAFREAIEEMRADVAEAKGKTDE